MKKMFFVFLSGMLFFAACSNDNSSTQGSYEIEETSTKEETEHHGSKKETKHEEPKEGISDTSATAPADTTVHH
jgi:hypothetical protein